MEQFDILEIVWRDHYTSDEWQDIDVDRDECLVRTLGYLVNEDAFYYHVAQSMTEDECSHVWSIIKEDIVHLENLS